MIRICYVKKILKNEIKKTYLPKCYTIGTAVNLSGARKMMFIQIRPRSQRILS